jgi:hypothetical protein
MTTVCMLVVARNRVMVMAASTTPGPERTASSNRSTNAVRSFAAA